MTAVEFFVALTEPFFEATTVAFFSDTLVTLTVEFF
jgi:hypothetical protein